MTPRRCLGCRRKIASGSRCERCDRGRARERQRHREQPWYGGDWRKVSRTMREDHVARYGLVCPGYQRAPHRVGSISDLTVDHVQARTRSGGLVVLCRSCNSSKGDR